MNSTVSYIDELDYEKFIPKDETELKYITFQNALNQGVRDVLTETQMTYMIEHFGNGVKQVDIAKKYGVNKSTVSRTIKRGLNNCKKLIKITK